MKSTLLAAATALCLFSGAAFAAVTADPPRFAGEDSAIAKCSRADTVWFNPVSKVFYVKTQTLYGKTDKGGYTCRYAAEKAGYRLAK